MCVETRGRGEQERMPRREKKKEGKKEAAAAKAKGGEQEALPRLEERPVERRREGRGWR